jgi:hypothetical protein
MSFKFFKIRANIDICTQLEASNPFYLKWREDPIPLSISFEDVPYTKEYKFK